MTKVSFENNIIIFGFATKSELKEMIQHETGKSVFADLTCYDPAEFYQEFPQLKGSFSALFCNDTKKIEIHFREKNDAVKNKFQELGFSLVETTIVSIGFVFPRTIAQIINEAHYALAEKVASREDIDRAMKFGVNYPKGPFEWSAGKEIIVKTLLHVLYEKTQDKRYIASDLL